MRRIWMLRGHGPARPLPHASALIVTSGGAAAWGAAQTWEPLLKVYHRRRSWGRGWVRAFKCQTFTSIICRSAAEQASSP